MHLILWELGVSSFSLLVHELSSHSLTFLLRLLPCLLMCELFIRNDELECPHNQVPVTWTKWCLGIVDDTMNCMSFEDIIDLPLWWK